ncbi:MAG: hypothetical protein WEB13_03810 [Dehalococcoidia bacterium]
MTREDDWEYSTEGDLDPDLTEEAGYAAWDPPARRWAPLAARALGALVLAAFLIGAIAVFAR